MIDEKELEKIIELLKLYRYLNGNANDYDLDYKEVEETYDKIDKLESEISVFTK